jgi:hypothetical protein
MATDGTFVLVPDSMDVSELFPPETGVQTFPASRITVRKSHAEKVRARRSYRRAYRNRPDRVAKRKERNADPDVREARRKRQRDPKVVERKRFLAKRQRLMINVLKEEHCDLWRDLKSKAEMELDGTPGSVLPKRSTPPNTPLSMDTDVDENEDPKLIDESLQAAFEQVSRRREMAQEQQAKMLAAVRAGREKRLRAARRVRAH